MGRNKREKALRDWVYFNSKPYNLHGLVNIDDLICWLQQQRELLSSKGATSILADVEVAHSDGYCCTDNVELVLNGKRLETNEEMSQRVSAERAEQQRRHNEAQREQAREDRARRDEQQAMAEITKLAPHLTKEALLAAYRKGRGE